MNIAEYTNVTTPRERAVRIAVLVTVLIIGAAYAHLLSVMHYQIAAGQQETVPCIIGNWFDCSGNLSSRYSTLLGLPVSSFAAAWFLFMLALLVSGMVQRRESRVTFRWVMIASLPAVVATLFYAFVALFVLNSLCVYCAGLYLVIALVAGLAVRGAELDWPKLGRQARSAAWWSFPAAAFVAVVVFEWRLAHAAKTQSIDLAALAVEPLPRLGPRNATLRLIVFSDFECGGCRKGAKELDRFLGRHLDEVEVLAVMFPVHRFYELAGGQTVPVAEYLACAMGVVMQQRGRFWDYYKGVFLSEAPVDDRLLWEIAERIVGVEHLQQFRRDLEAPAVGATLRRNAAIATRYKIDRTPSYLVNGELVAGPMQAGALEARLTGAREFARSEPPVPAAHARHAAESR